MQPTQWDDKNWDVPDPKDKKRQNDSPEDANLCDSCRLNAAMEFHRCKYAMKVLNNFEFYCNCCEDCRQRCVEMV